MVAYDTPRGVSVTVCVLGRVPIKVWGVNPRDVKKSQHTNKKLS